MKLSRSDVVPLRAIIAGWAVGVLTSGALVLSRGTVRRALTLVVLTGGLACSDEASTPALVARDSLGIRLIRAASDGERLSLSPLPFSAELPEFGDILDVAMTTSGLLVVLDPLGPSVVVLDSTGAEQTRFGRDGEGPGEFRAAGLTGLVLVGDTIIVPDAFNQRVTFFDLEGRLMREFAMSSGDGFTLDWHSHPDRGLIYRRMSFPQRLETVGMLGSDLRVVQDLTHLSLPPEAGPLTPLPAWCVLPDGQLVSARTDRYRVTVTDDGTPTAVLSGDVGDRPFGDAELAHLHELVRESLAQRMQAEVDLQLVRGMIEQMVLPEEAPRLGGVVCSEAGEVWVQHALPVLELGPGVIRVGSPEAWRSPVWDVFDVGGSRVRRVLLPEKAHITRVTRDVVVGFTTDEYDRKIPARWSHP